MKISSTTLTILRYCSMMSDQIVIEAGNIIKTANEFGTMMLTCRVEETFPHQVRLYNLKDFTRVVGLFEDPEFDFGVDSVVISDNSGNSMLYQYSKLEDLIYESRNSPKITELAQFPLSDKQLKNIRNAATMNNVEDICFRTVNGKVEVAIHNKKRIEREFKIATGVTTDDNFSIYLSHGRKISRLDLMPLDYVVRIGTTMNVTAVTFTASNDTTYIEYIAVGAFNSYANKAGSSGASGITSSVSSRDTDDDEFEDGIPF